jgi:tetratricopeptide (TPR) repeat protein
MNTAELLAQLETAQTEQAKAALVAEFTLSKLPEPVANAARRCGFLPWFTTDIIKAQLEAENGAGTAEAVEHILGLSFVEQLAIGYTFHSQTRQGLIELYTKRQPDEIVLAYQQALPVWEADRENDAAATAAICGWAVVGDHDNFTKGVNQFVYLEIEQGEWDSLNQLVEALSEVEAYPFVKPLPDTWLLQKTLITIFHLQFGQKNYDAAIAGYNLLIEVLVKQQGTGSQLSATYFLRGRAYQQKGEYDQAIADFDQAITLKPDDAGTYSSRGDAYRKKGEYDRAIADYDQALALEPDYAEAYYGRGLTYSLNGEYDRAIKDFDQALALKPGYAEAYYGRGLTYRLKGEHDHAIADFDQALALKPDYAEAHYRRGLIYNLKGEHDRAITDFDQALALKPDDGETYKARGDAYRQKGGYDRAIKDYDQALALKPDYAEAYNYRGLIYGVKGEYDRAIADLDQALALKPDYAQAYNYRGLGYSMKGEHDRAIADYDQAITLKPDDAEAYNYRGLAYSVKGEHDRAIADLDQAITLKPDYAEAYKSRGEAYWRKGEYNRAIADYDQAITLKPDYADAYNYRGIVYQEKGDLGHSVADFLRVLDLEAPKDQHVLALERLGLAYRQLEQFEKAIQTLKQLLDIAPENATAHLSLAACYRQLGNESAFEEQAAKVRRLMAGENEYNRACMESVLGNLNEALDLLEVALAQNQQSVDWVRQDPDLDNIRDMPRFKELLAKYSGKS